MPDRDVRTVRDLIFYQYAKIIARRAFSAPDGKEADTNLRFIIFYLQLKEREILRSTQNDKTRLPRLPTIWASSQ